MDQRARLSALFDTRRAVRAALAEAGISPNDRRSGKSQPEREGASGDRSAPLVLVALSGGADSLALAAAVAFEMGAGLKRSGGSAEAVRGGIIRAGAVVVDHGLQAGSTEVAERAAAQARELGLDPVLVRRVEVGGARVQGASAGVGPEAAAREARYEALLDIAEQTGAVAILTAHTRDDQAEQVILALARGSGLRSVSGIPPVRLVGVPPRRPSTGWVVILRPFLVREPEITRATTELACAAEGLEHWSDPQNSDPAYTRVRVRGTILPMLESELGPGVAAALARTADLAREDAEALDKLAESLLAELAPTIAKSGALDAASEVTLLVAALEKLPAALRNRVIRRVAQRDFGAHLSREHTLTVAALVTNWRGQGPINVPGVVVARDSGALVFRALR